MSSSLELNGAKGISGAELCVFADRPLLWQAVILGQTLCLIVLTGWDARGQAHMLTYQTTTTAPGWEEKVEVNVIVYWQYYTVLCRVQVKATALRETTVALRKEKRRGWQGEIACDWERERKSTRAAIVMCLAVRGGQGWNDSLSSDFHLMIGRRGGEKSVGRCKMLLALSLFAFEFLSPLFYSPPPCQQLQDLAEWQLYKF